MAVQEKRPSLRTGITTLSYWEEQGRDFFIPCSNSPLVSEGGDTKPQTWIPR